MNKTALDLSMKPAISIESTHRLLVEAILTTHLPFNTQVWVFGSRATGDARKQSDLDLLINWENKPLPYQIKLQLIEAFDESRLPYKVDLVDFNDISESFKQQIYASSIPLIKT